MTGIRATFAIDDPPGCPVADASRTTRSPVESVVRSSPADPEASVIEEFSVDDRTPPDSAGGGDDRSADPDLDVTPIASGDRTTVYRFERERDPNRDCACEVVEGHGTPVSSIRAEDGTLLVSVRSPGLDAVREIVADLRERFDGVRLRELVRTGSDERSDLVFVDRSRLTPRQREVLRTAHELGYFEYPRAATATEVADAIGIARSTFDEHVAAAQTNLLDAVLEQ